MSAFNPSAWVRRLEAIGGRIRPHDGSLWLWVPMEADADAVNALSAEIVAPGHKAAVRQYVSGRP